jgi:hypothetical protein
MITKLAPNQIFVFGSHLTGHHAGGAARQAVDRFGAIVGQGEGLQGQSYAIPTMHGEAVFRTAIQTFVAFAAEHPELEFLLTRVGCGIAGYPENNVIAIFRDALPAGWPENIVPPAGWQ